MNKLIFTFILSFASALYAREQASIQATAYVEPAVGTMMINDTIYIMNDWTIYPVNSGTTNVDVKIEYIDLTTMLITIIPSDI